MIKLFRAVFSRIFRFSNVKKKRGLRCIISANVNDDGTFTLDQTFR